MKKEKDIKIIFFGTPEFSVPALLKLIDSGYRPLLVITQPDKPAGRNQKMSQSPIKKIALENNLALAQPKNKKELNAIVNDVECDVGVLAAFGQILSKEVLEKPKFGILNIHPSLLPKYRGSSPIQNAILNGDKETGVSIIKLTSKLDAGPIFGQSTIVLSSNDNSEIVHDKLAKQGAELLISILPDYVAGKSIGKVQDETKATFTKNINREDGLINWKDGANVIERKFRAFSPWPGVFTHLENKRLKIADLSVLEADLTPDLAPGTVFLTENHELAVACGNGIILLNSLQLEGKKTLLSKDFILGNKIVGKILK